MIDKKIAVVGSGIIGLTTAFRLKQNFSQVTLISPKETLGEKASKAAVGISSMKGLFLARDPLFELKILGHRNFPNFLNEVAKQAKFTKTTYHKGVRECFASTLQYQSLRERIFHGSFTGLHSFSLERNYDTDEILSSFLGAFNYVEDLFFQPDLVLDLIKKSFLSLGGNLHEDRLQKISPESRGGLKLHLEKQEYDFEEVVLACGARSMDFLNKICSEYSFPFFTTPGLTLHIQSNENGPDWNKKRAFNIARLGLNQNKKNFRFGSKDLKKNMKPTAQLLNETAKVFQEELSLFSPALANMQASLLWGERLALKDRRPLFGSLDVFSKTRRLWINCGYHKNGYDLADLFAQELSSQLCGAKVKSRFTSYLPSRFI